jgi:hypothetical protein
LLIGWREYVSLPNLGLPVLKAKVDTGARTSALHAFKIETFQDHGVLKVRFQVHPVQRRSDIIVTCEAPVIDHRVVSDSGGHRERRYVIETMVTIGSLKWPIEVTLANRESMTFRMLLGRNAMGRVLIDPARSFLLGKPLKVAGQYKPSAKKHRKKSGGKITKHSAHLK